ncbi:hypothetical protein Tco_0700435 [Tanacetum coccineum]
MPERQALSYMGNCLMGNDDMAMKYTQSNTMELRYMIQIVTKYLIHSQVLWPISLSSGSDVLSEGRQISVAVGTTKTYTPGTTGGQATQTVITHNAAFQTEDLDTYDSDCDDLSNAQAVLIANISSYSSDVIFEVPNPEQFLNDIENQSVHAMQDFEQTPDMDLSDNEIHSDSDIIPYSQYLQETQQAIVQDTNLQAQQDSITLSTIEQMSEQMINHEHN